MTFRLSASRYAPLAVALVLAVAFTIGMHADEPRAAEADPSSGDAVLAVTSAKVPRGAGDDALRKALAGVSAELAGLPGFVSTEVTFLEVKGSGRAMLRATVWRSVRDAEAAALATDGSEATRGLRALVPDQRSTFYRQLRAAGAVSMAAGHLEVTKYRTRPGTTRDVNLARFDKAAAAFASSDGVLGDSMWIAPDGEWVHLVRWRSGADFARAAKALMEDKAVGGWIRSLDFKRFRVMRGDVLGARSGR